MVRILVVGGAGYIGAHACKALAEAGHEPVVFDNLSLGHAEAVQWGPLEIGDIGNAERLDEVLVRHRPEAVMHFAARSNVGESVGSPDRYYHNNVVGTLSLLDAMRRHSVRSIVFSSTCAVYGIPATFPIDETQPVNPINPYGFTKLVVERALADYNRAYGLNWVALRYFNAAGADPGKQIGEWHDPETHIIPLAIRAAMGLGPEFQVFGTDYPTPDGTAIRDYVHVNDIADAHIKALSYLSHGGASMAINLGTGRGTSVREILAAVEKTVGKPVPVRYGPRRAGDPPALFARADRAADILGWHPTYLDIEPIVATAAAWTEHHHENQNCVMHTFRTRSNAKPRPSVVFEKDDAPLAAGG